MTLSCGHRQLASRERKRPQSTRCRVQGSVSCFELEHLLVQWNQDEHRMAARRLVSRYVIANEVRTLPLCRVVSAENRKHAKKRSQFNLHHLPKPPVQSCSRDGSIGGILGKIILRKRFLGSRRLTNFCRFVLMVRRKREGRKGRRQSEVEMSLMQAACAGVECICAGSAGSTYGLGLGLRSSM